MPLSIAALLLTAAPLAAQDFLRGFEDFVEQMLPTDEAPSRPRPVAEDDAPIEPATPTPVEERPELDEADMPLPRPRPEGADAEPEADEPVVETEDEPDTAPEPEIEPVAEPAPANPEPDRIYQTACPALLSGVVVGEMLQPIAEGICGERSPLSISAVRVNGREIGLSSPVTTNCEMAGAFADWVGEVDLYAAAALDSAVTTVNTGTSFICRNRYSAEDGFVSEHGFANALDITGFTLANGETVAVEADWMPAAAPEGRLLRQAHGAACGRFTTVLGPEANAEHEDHLHLDLGCHGQTCTAQICE